MAFNEFFTEMILPFLLVFVVTFAILQKSKLLGAGKTQIDALVGLVIGLLVIGLPITRHFINDFIPWVAVGISVILVFFILYGFVAGDLEKDEGIPGPMKIGFGVLAGLFVIGILLYMTGFGTTLVDFLGLGDSAGVMNFIIIVIVLGLVAWVIFGGKSE